MNKETSADILAESLVELVLEHVGLSEHADQEARRFSKIGESDLESLEGTTQHELYWLAYAGEQARIIGMVQQKLFRIPK